MGFVEVDLFTVVHGLIKRGVRVGDVQTYNGMPCAVLTTPL